jgi:hypothetical protein
MRIEIKTKSPVKDTDVKALYLLNEAMHLSSDKMRQANLDFVKSKYGLK